jgi:Flp pilus assembly protein TadD
MMSAPRRSSPTQRRPILPVFLLLLSSGFWPACLLLAADQGEVLSKEGQVDFSRRQAQWSNAIPGQKLEAQDRLRTRALSRALVRLVELGRVRLDELTTLEILPPRNPNSKGTLDLKAGAIYFFTRDRPREFEIRTPQALAASRGTEFLVSLQDSGREVFTMFDGEAEVSNPLGTIVLAAGEQGVVDPGQAPRKTAVLQATNLVQWWLYYPAVLNPAELTFSPAEQTELAAALDAYRQGDLLQALEAFPPGWAAQTDSGRIFEAAVWLAVGQVDQAETRLSTIDSLSPQANALRQLIAAVQLRTLVTTDPPRTATEWLTDSYVQQSRYALGDALRSAQQAAEIAPDFGFTWARVAELEFSFGRAGAASKALHKALEICPRNAQAWALKGFVLAAGSHWRDAADAFNQAIALDPALGNGWLGRGLIEIRRGDKDAGRTDLQTAAALEPNRSVLRSYLAKGFDAADDVPNAERELALAKALDAHDPTPWLYSALILRQQLRYNQAVSELEESVQRNDNRRVYRSRLLLDEDQAVRSASLATIYRQVGMDQVSVREAARSVTYDYANHSAHQFLAESFDALRDPTRFNLRYETAWFNELLLANLLSPVGAGNLSQNISQQEYSRLFAADRLGLSSVSEYRSDGQFRELASQFGTVGRFSYALDLDYQHNDGVRPNNELDRIEWYSTAKFQLSPKDAILLLAKYQDYHSGDNFQHYDPGAVRTDLEPYGLTNAPVIRTNFSFDEFQTPWVVGGYHREWSPGIHTTLLGGRLENDQRFSDSNVLLPILIPSTNAQQTALFQIFNIQNRSEFEIYTAEINQIFQLDRHLVVLGARYQDGTFHTRDQVTLVNTNFLAPFFNDPPAAGDIKSPFERISAYGYYTLEVIPNLHLTGGLTYDQVLFPTNFRQPPISEGSTRTDQLSPKAALVWSPLPEFTLRGVYTRSLGGVSFDQSFRLEPTQLAGFVQSFRTIMPESIVGSVSAPTYETAGAAMDLKFKTRTYVGLQLERLESEVDTFAGVFQNSGVLPPPPSMTPSLTPQHHDYQEHSALFSVNQLLSDGFALGAQYQFTRSELHTVFPGIAVSPINPDVDRTRRADLHQATLFALFNHPSGFFARAESQWYHQQNFDYSPALPTEDFWQHNVFVGYRFRRQRGELSFGVLNLAGTDYRLNPLSLYSELPRERVFVGRLKVNF